MTCSDWPRQLNSSKCLTKEVMAISMKMNRLWYSRASRKRCSSWQQNFAMFKNTLFIKTWWRKFVSWKQTSASSKMSWELLSSQNNWQNISRLEMRSSKNSSEIGSSILKNLNSKVWLKLKSSNTIMRIKCKCLTKSWTVLLKISRSSQKPSSKKCKWMRSS